MKLPPPERPIREDDVQRPVIPAVTEQRRHDLGVLPAVEVGADDGPVDGVEHELEVGDAAGVAAEQLEDAPDGEEVPRLERRAEPLDVGPAPEHDEAEGGGEAGAVEHGARDPARGAPWAEVLVDEAEVGRARAV